MNTFRNRALALASVALLATTLSACSDDDSAEGGQAKDLKVTVFASLNGVPTFAGKNEGLFADHDLTVDITSVRTSTEMVPQLLGGSADFALMDTATSMVAAAQGVPLVFVAGGTEGGIPSGQEEFSFANVWVAKNSPIKSFADLEGKKFGIPQIKSAPWVDVRAAVDADGGDSAKIDFIESPDPLSSLKSGQVDAVTTPEPVGTVEKSKGDLRLLGPVNSGGGEIAYSWVTTKAFAQKNPDVVGEFAEAVREVNAAVNSDDDLRLATAVEVLEAPEELLSQAAFPVYAEDELVTDDIAGAIDYLSRYDMFEKGAPNPDDLLFSN